MAADRERLAQEAAAGRQWERSAKNISPGGWSVDSNGAMGTILGSCVSVCLYDRQLNLGGMNHFLLPSRGSGQNDDEDIILAGDFAMEVLVNALLGKGAKKARLVAKAFGGGAIVGAIRMPIGERNAAFARHWLDQEGIPLVASDLGGAWARKVVCVPATGEAFCRRIPVNRESAEALVRSELDYQKSLSAPKPRGGVDLF